MEEREEFTSSQGDKAAGQARPWYEDVQESEGQWRPRRNSRSGEGDASQRRGREDFGGRPREGRDDHRGRGEGRDGYRSERSDRFDRRGKGGSFRKGGRRDEQREGFRSERSERFERSDRGDRFGRGERFDRRSKGGRFEERRGGDRFDRGAERGERQRGGIRRLPSIPDSVTPQQLDKAAWRQLSPLNKEVAEKVARHLVMAGNLVDVDPEEAYKHAQAALKLAWRIDVVREAVALTAYASGRYHEALREVRTVRRMSGLDVLRTVEADAERGLGRPEKAIEIINATDVSALDPSEAVELAIVASGARADLGEHETGLAVINEALAKVDQDDEYLLRRLLTVKVDRLRELGRFGEAEEVEAQIPAEFDEVDILDLEAEVEEEEKSNPTPLRGTNQALVSEYPHLLLDLDGVAFAGDSPVEGAASGLAAARELGAKVCFLTNNAARPGSAVVEKLGRFEIPATVAEVLTAAQDGAAVLAKMVEEGAKVLALGGPGVSAALEEVGLQPVTTLEEEPVAILQGLGFDLDWKTLSQASILLNSRPETVWVATNMDTTLPTEQGLALGNGSLVAALQAASGRQPIVCGKPEAGIYRKAMARLSSEEQEATREDTLAVGDRLGTDIAGANSARIPSLHVLTGVSTAQEVALAPAAQRPSFLALDLTDLAKPMPRPFPLSQGWWRCEEATVRVRQSIIQVRGLGDLSEGDEISLNEYRALVAAAWNYADKGHEVICPAFRVVREVERDYSAEEPLEELAGAAGGEENAGQESDGDEVEHESALGLALAEAAEEEAEL